MKPAMAYLVLALLVAPAEAGAAEGPVSMVFFGVRGVHEDQQVVKDTARLVEMAAEERKVTLFSEDDVRKELEKDAAWQNILQDANQSLKEARDKYVELDMEGSLTRVERAQKFLATICGEVLYRKAVYEALALYGLLLWQKGDKSRAVERFRQAVLIAPEARPPSGLFSPDVELAMEEARISSLGSQKPAATYDQLCECVWKFGSPFMLFGHIVSSPKGKGITLMLYGAERADMLASRNAALEGSVEEIKQGITTAANALFASAEDATGSKRYGSREKPKSAGGAPFSWAKVFPPFSQNPWAYSLAGASLLCLGTGITFSVLTAQAEADYELLISPERNAVPDPDALEQVRSAGEVRAAVATVAYVSAGALAAGSVYFFIWPPGGDSSAKNAAAPAPLALTPVPGGAALTYGTTW